MSYGIVIASVLRERGPTGVQTYARTVRDYLRATGRPVQLVTPMSAWTVPAAATFGARRLIDPFSMQLSTWWHRWWHYVFLRLALKRKLVDTGEPITIFAQCPLAARAALDARPSDQHKVVMAVHYSISAAEEAVMRGHICRGDWAYRDIKQWESHTLPRLDGLVYVSDFMRNVLEQENPLIARVPSVVVPNFVAPPPTATASGSAGDMITVGSLEPRKNQRYLLQVLHEARRQGHDYSLALVGDGPDRRALENEARSLGLEDKVRFLGYRPDAAALLGGYRAYVHSALIENLPIALMEAMAAHLPILAAPVGGISEMFADGVQGYYWPLDDPATGARQLIDLLEVDGVYSRMSRAARNRFDTQFAPDVVGGRLVEFLERTAVGDKCAVAARG